MSNDVALLTLLFCTCYFLIKFEQGNAGWAESLKIGVIESSCLLSVVWIR